MYARRKRWPLEAVTVRLQHSKIHAADCEECETKVGRLDQIECEVELRGVLSEEQHIRLLEIANKCPVHRTLTSEVRIQSRPRRREDGPLGHSADG
jgi:putative redox protein